MLAPWRNTDSSAHSPLIKPWAFRTWVNHLLKLVLSIGRFLEEVIHGWKKGHQPKILSGIRLAAEDHRTGEEFYGKHLKESS
jgi:hypothetical protein